MLKKILIIRHAEKPIPGVCVGIKPSGREDAASLSVPGWQRAGAIVQLFEHLSPPRVGIETPTHLYGARYDKFSTEPSRRSVQTLDPLSRSMGLRVADEFGKGQEKKLVAAISKHSGVVMIAWAHEDIGAIVAAIRPVGPQPPEWPDARFDLVWIFDKSPRGWTFSQTPQQLMAGDADTVAT